MSSTNPQNSDESKTPEIEKYKLRFFFEYQVGTCLWSANELARQKFGYPVELSELELPKKMRDKIKEINDRFETCINWDQPNGPAIWTENQRLSFNQAAKDLFLKIQNELGQKFEIIDESALDEEYSNGK